MHDAIRIGPDAASSAREAVASLKHYRELDPSARRFESAKVFVESVHHAKTRPVGLSHDSRFRLRDGPGEEAPRAAAVPAACPSARLKAAESPLARTSAERPALRTGWSTLRGSHELDGYLRHRPTHEGNLPHRWRRSTASGFTGTKGWFPPPPPTAVGHISREAS